MLTWRPEHHLRLDPKYCMGTTFGKNYSIHKRWGAGWEEEEKLDNGIRTKTLVSTTLLIFQI